MKTQVDVTAPTNLQVVCTPVPGAGDFFDLTFTDPAEGHVIIRRVPRKQVAALGLAAMDGMSPQNVAFHNYRTWQNGL